MVWGRGGRRGGGGGGTHPPPEVRRGRLDIHPDDAGDHAGEHQHDRQHHQDGYPGALGELRGGGGYRPPPPPAAPPAPTPWMARLVRQPGSRSRHQCLTMPVWERVKVTNMPSRYKGISRVSSPPKAANRREAV